MKLKARDIIAGWPRGRSTMCLYDRPQPPYSLFYLPLDEAKKAWNELVQTGKYHSDQQVMVDRWRVTPETWSLFRGDMGIAREFTCQLRGRTEGVNEWTWCFRLDAG